MKWYFWWATTGSTDACDDLHFAVGFRTVPMMALKIPNPWNAQSLSYEAKPLRMYLSPHSTIITSTTKRVCFHALLMMMFTHGQIDQCLYMYCSPSADKWKTQGWPWGSLSPCSFYPLVFSLSFLPPYPLLCLTSRHKTFNLAQAGPTQILAAGSGSLYLLLWGDKSLHVDCKEKEAHMQYSYENYKAGSSKTWHYCI